MLIEERDNRLSNYLAPSFTILGLLASTSAFALAFAFINAFLGILPQDQKLYSLSLNFLADIAAVLLIFAVIMPLVDAGKIRYRRVNLENTLKMLALFCLTYLAVLAFQIVFLSLLDIIYPVEPVNPYDSISPVDEEVTNPFHLLLYLAVLVIAAPLYEELAFRRILIPMLEERGMSPMMAIFSSSLVFASAHTPNDIISGNLRFAIEHFFPILILGITMGVLYVTTRNVIYPMIVHAMFNGISGVGTIALELYEQNINMILLAVFGFVVLAILLLGIVIVAFILFKLVTNQPLGWFEGLTVKKSNQFIPGFIGFIGVFWTIMTVETLINNLNIENVVLRLLLFLVVEFSLFFGSIWLVKNTVYKGEGRSDSLEKEPESTTKTDSRLDSKTKVCGYCGVINQESARFCKNCGNNLGRV